MKTTITLLQMSIALLCSAQDPNTLPPAPAPAPVYLEDPSRYPAGEYLVSGGRKKQAALACFVGAGIMAVAVADAERRATLPSSEIKGWYNCVWVVGLVGLGLEISGNAKIILAGRTLRGDRR